jgi:DNA-binding PucR family transcriptional regulator
LDDVQISRQEAERVLDAMARDLDDEVATLADVRSQVLVSEILALLQDNPRIRDPGIDALDPELAKTLLAYLDALGDVRAAADRLHVHPNTLRYRLKRARESGDGLDLDDPLVRLVAQLQLRMR